MACIDGRTRVAFTGRGPHILDDGQALDRQTGRLEVVADPVEPENDVML